MVNYVKRRQIRPYRYGPVHSGDKVKRTFDIRATKITNFRQKSTELNMFNFGDREPATVNFRQNDDKSAKKSTFNIDADYLSTSAFVASVYRP